MGEFNEVRNKNERFGTNINVHGANVYLTLLSQGEFRGGSTLWDVFLHGVTDLIQKMIKLDRVPHARKLTDERDASSDTLHKRAEVVKSIQEVDKLCAMEASQKAKIKWAIEGDENSKYYHVLNISLKELWTRHELNGIVLNSVMHLSHMFYADDAVFMGQWSTKNIDTIIYVLKCFHRASGLSINLSKSKLLGVVVSEDMLCKAANRIGCGVS
ncbi:hypothetical protein Tco_0951003 [Tanacetum coccineum]|uniref:RNA-directed DNA polymerase, eukaryota n=1 Tax=Tanacetum coccineum TaxID=301880 RepID=A0ABQ5DUN7_9ASTR